MSKKIVITGGIGYIGTELCKIYSGISWNNEITVIDNRFISERVNQLRNWNMNFVHGDILDKELVNKNTSNYKKIKNLQFKHFDLLKPSKSFFNKFDVVISMDVIEHFNKKKLGIVVDSYYNLLNSDGFAIIGTPNIASRPYASQRRLDTHEFEFTRDEFEKTLLKKFKNVFIFSMTDEVVSTSFPNMAWFFIAICTK